MIPKIPIETGMFDSSLAVNFYRGLHHSNNALQADEFESRLEVDNYWENASTLCIPALIAAMVARINLLGLAQPTHHVDTIPIHQGMNQVNAVRANAEYWVNHGFAGVALNGLYPPRLEFCTVTSDFSAAVPVFRTYSVSTNGPQQLNWRARVSRLSGLGDKQL